MTTPPFLVHDSAKNPDADIWFAEPPGFIGLPLDALSPPQGSPPPGDRAELAVLLDSAPDDKCRQLLLGQLSEGLRLLEALREVGTVHCSLGLHRDDVEEGGEGQTLLSLLALSWRAIATAPPAVTAARAVTSQAPPHTRIEYLEDLPCGPATLSETLRTPAAGDGLVRQALLQVHAHLPHPDGKRLAVLTLSTTAVGRREAYRRMLRQLVAIVSFEDPLTPGEA
ncbi:hypothetical protein [Streptomyces sp. NPDC023327]|uniref:hypothetical protein n=1 Tax=Streptomyces sp. NPDC023327 TaxID=3157088 RepID=UPI0033CEE0B3